MSGIVANTAAVWERRWRVEVTAMPGRIVVEHAELRSYASARTAYQVLRRHYPGRCYRLSITPVEISVPIQS